MTDNNFQLQSSFRASLARYLSSDIVEALPDKPAYIKATRHLNTLRVALSSYLPKYVADKEELLTEEHSDLRLGTFMFADVSGFTALSEKLQRATGIEGAEIMTQIINSFFSTMLEVLAKSDGQMLKFAGDALLTFFPVTSEEGDRPDLIVAAKAIRTGLRMQREMMAKFQPIENKMLKKLFGEHDLELKMSIGIASGYLFEALVGNASQRDHMIMGTLPGEADDAEGAGVRDDVIVHQSLAAELGDAFRFGPAPDGDDYLQVIDDLGDELSDFELTSIITRRKTSLGAFLSLAENDEAGIVEELRTLVTRVDNYARFVAAEVVNKLAIEGDRVEAQNRPAVVIFAYFKGIADMLDDWGAVELPRITAILNRFYSGVQQTIAAYGGALTRSDPYKVGSKLLITFGAPIAHPDDAFRAVATGLGMLDWLESFNQQLHNELPSRLRRQSYIELRMGIASGQAFAGEVGWKQRREYTVMGDDVNLAARLMGKSVMGHIWISESVYNRVERYFDTEALEPMMMKGKSDPIQAYSVVGWNPGITDVPRTSNTKFVGRDAMLLTLQLSLEQAKARRRRTITLVGDTGMGKTRVAKQLLAEADGKGFNSAWATCLTMDYARNTWASIMSQLLALPNDQPMEVQYDAFLDALEAFAITDFHDPLSLLLFGYVATHDDLHQTIDPRLKATGAELEALLEELQSVIIATLQVLADDRPLFVVLDDLHKANPYAVTILENVIAAIKRGRIVLLVTYEPHRGVTLDTKSTVMEDLSEDETFRIAAEILKASELGPTLRTALWNQAHGRPVFVESLLQLWQERNTIIAKSGVTEIEHAKSSNVLPDNVRTLVISQIDHLNVDEQNLMRAAAVLSFVPDVAIQLDMLQHVAGIDDIGQALDSVQALVSQKLLDEHGGALRIHYGLTQSAAYESLSRMQRQRYHGSAADYFLRRDDAGDYFFVILKHMVAAGKLMRALEMVEKAAQTAEEAGDYETALEFLDQALSLFPNDRSIQTAITRLLRHATNLVSGSDDPTEQVSVMTGTNKITTDSITKVMQTMIENDSSAPTRKSKTTEAQAVDASPDDDWLSLLKKKSKKQRKKK